jgi:predicted RNA-binding protein YlqC (UPF0109 family)
LLSVQGLTPDDGQRNCPKHVVSFQNKFEKLVHLVGFIIRKFVTMHGHVNVHLVGFIVRKFVTMHGHVNVHLVGLIVRKFVTMHGHMNAKKKHVRIEITATDKRQPRCYC